MMERPLYYLILPVSLAITGAGILITNVAVGIAKAYNIAYNSARNALNSEKNVRNQQGRLEKDISAY